MVSHDSRPYAFKNRILASLPQAEMARLKPHLHQTKLEHHHSMAEDGQTLADAYFLEDGIASIVVTTEEGRRLRPGSSADVEWLGFQSCLVREVSPDERSPRSRGRAFASRQILCSANLSARENFAGDSFGTCRPS
jgi:CRP-like cAMP-binding protein